MSHGHKQCKKFLRSWFPCDQIEHGSASSSGLKADLLSCLGAKYRRHRAITESFRRSYHRERDCLNSSSSTQLLHAIVLTKDGLSLTVALRLGLDLGQAYPKN